MLKKLICLIVVLSMAMTMSGCLAALSTAACTSVSRDVRPGLEYYDYSY